MFDLIFPSAMAQDAAGAAAQQNPIMSFIPFILVFFVFYFLMVRPQKKRLEQEKARNEALKKGDEIYTKSGLIGKIVGLTDTIIDLEISQGVRVKVLRSSVADSTDSLFKTSPQGTENPKLAKAGK